MSKKMIGMMFVAVALIVVIFFWSGAFRPSVGRPSDSTDASVVSKKKDVSGDSLLGQRDIGPEPTYFARVVDGEVTNMIVAEPDFIETFDDGSPGEWIQTWYNLSGGVHYDPNTGQPDGKDARRKNTAGIGYSYDKDLDAFIPPKPFDSWKLNEETALWEAPVARPDDEGKKYGWNEDEQAWKEVEFPEMPVAESSDSKE